MANEAEVQIAVDQALKAQKKKKRLIIFMVIIIIISIIAVITSKPENYDFDNPSQITTVDVILDDFKNDSANASEKYSNKVVAITGQVGTIQDDYATIRGYDDDNWLYNVNAFPENHEDLKKFKVGDTVTIEGVCENTTLFGDVDIKKCIITDEFSIIPDYDNAQAISFDDFVKAYQENQVKADDNYKGKTLEFNAVVSYVFDDYITVESKNADMWDWDSEIQICFEDADELKKVSEGKSFTIVGECYGKADVYTAKICRAIIK